MPTARNGEWLSQRFIERWSGAWHWSKPSPVKSPGVTTFPSIRACDACAGAAPAVAGAAPSVSPAVVPSRPVTSNRAVATAIAGGR